MKGFKKGGSAYMLQPRKGGYWGSHEHIITGVIVEQSGRDLVRVCFYGDFVPEDGCDFLRWADGHCTDVMLFPTKEAAQRGAEKLKMIGYIRRYARGYDAFGDVPFRGIREIYKILGGGSEEG